MSFGKPPLSPLCYLVTLSHNPPPKSVTYYLNGLCDLCSAGALPIVDNGEENAHKHVEVDNEEDDEEEGEPPLVIVGGHHDVRAVGGRDQDEQVPEGIEEVVEVELAPDFR